MTQIKINIELSVSKNFNKVTIGIPDQPIAYEKTEELRHKIKVFGKILREEAEYQLNQIGSKPIEDKKV